MKYLKYCGIKSIVLLCLLFTNVNFGQNKKNVDSDEKVEQLLIDKRKANSGITINDKYKIQIFSGELEESKKTLQLFKSEFKNFDGTIAYNNPAYKVWIGSFKNKIEAEKAITTIKKKYPNAVIIQPNKK
jgi:hypothetical protein